MRVTVMAVELGHASGEAKARRQECLPHGDAIGFRWARRRGDRLAFCGWRGDVVTGWRFEVGEATW
jgi:hypothetical protein